MDNFSMLFANGQIILPDRLFAGSLKVQNGLLARGGTKSIPLRSGDIDLQGGYLSPGFVDLHIHGAVGRDTMEATEEAYRSITGFHLGGGTTSLTLTTMTASEQAILDVLHTLRPLHNISLGGARIVGVHVEGPFISPKRAGAQDPVFIRNPIPEEYQKILKFGKLITQMTVAPEIPGALPLIKALRKNGSIASGGHTDAAEADLFKGLKAGMNQATHTFNAMSTITKNGPFRMAGMIEFALAKEEVMCELIADGVHVPPILMQLLFKAKGRDKVCLITDATAGAGLKPGTQFRLGGPDSVPARVTKETAVMSDGTGLAGSTLKMIEAVRRSVQLANLPLVDAVRMASLNPARQLGRDAEFGSIENGKRADLVWFDKNFVVRGVWLDGERRFSA